MAADFTPMFTRAGLAAVRAASGRGLSASISALALGSGVSVPGGWGGYAPTGAETALKNEIARSPILSGEPIGTVAGSDPLGFRVMAQFPPLAPGAPGAPILEVGVFLDDGTLLCVWSSASGAADVLGSLNANAVFDLAFDLYLTSIPASALSITVQAEAPPDNLACLAQLLRASARNFNHAIRSSHRLARAGIRE